jgi:para-aminobenzoate synthetase/4-amino-4-deoxychorismate lyase
MAPDEVPGVLRAAEAAAQAGSWVAGFVAYDAAPGLDPALSVRVRPADDPIGPLPLAWFGAFESAANAPLSPPCSTPVDWALEWTAADHHAAVDAIKGLIAAGDTYQVNLTTRAHARVVDPEGLYGSLVTAQGGVHSAFIRTPTHAVASASPELFFAVDGRHLTARPMKGTARRGRTRAEDTAASAALRASPKELAENVMIVDLVRNDVGRIATTGSVTVPALFDIERYPSVWQLTSTIAGELRADLGLAEIFGALFPSGSVTGAPKRRTMAIIADLEPRPRGVYCGAVGLLEPGATLRASFSVAIRTATTNLATGYTEYGTGGGITWASDPDKEWDELNAKAAILRYPRADGLFETMRAAVGGVMHVDLHLDRIAASAGHFHIPFDRRRALASLAGVRGPARVRLDLSAGGALDVTTSPLPSPSDGPVRVGLADEPVDSRDPVTFHKLADRSRYDRRLRPDVDDVVLVNERGEVTETTIANLAVWLDGLWCTPPVRCGLLPGIERARLIGLGLLFERVITVDELCASTGVALISALRGWRRAVVV